MSNDARSLHLDQPGTAWDINDSAVVDRKPISLLPSSPTRINWPRLPHPSAMRGMELAFRHQLVPDEAARLIARYIAAPVVAIAYFLAFLIPMIAAVMPFQTGMTAIGGLSAFLIAYRLYRFQNLTFFYVLATVILPILTLLLLHSLSFIFANRIMGTVIFAVFGFILLRINGTLPSEFYSDWIHTAAFLRPEDRRAGKSVSIGPDLRLFLLVVLIALAVPWLSSLLAILLIAAICAYVCRRDRYGLDLIEKAHALLAPYLTYGTRLMAYQYRYFSRAVPFAPGVWAPSTDVGRRRWGLYDPMRGDDQTMPPRCRRRGPQSRRATYAHGPNHQKPLVRRGQGPLALRRHKLAL